jgi:hypothetical protein
MCSDLPGAAGSGDHWLWSNLVRLAFTEVDQRSHGIPDVFPPRVAIMIFVRFAFAILAAATAVALSTLGTVSAPAAEGDRVDARFEIYGFAGFHVLTNRTSVQEAGDRYAIAMDLDTRGLASVFVDLTSHSEARGGLATDTARPDAYRADVRRNGDDRHYAVDYRRDGTVINASTLSSTARPFLVSVEQIRGAVDQLTAYFILERQLARSGKCSLVVPVFDGSGYYNLRFAEIGREMLSADGYQNFAGPSEICKVAREDIVVNPDRNEDTYKEGRIWYAQVIAGDRMVPVRMEFDTAFGSVKGYLAELRGRGANLHLLRE